MKSALKKMLWGDTVVTEYSKITVPDEIREKVYLEAGGQLIDVSIDHWILCIDPLVFGVWIASDVLPVSPAGKTGYSLYVSDGRPASHASIRKNAVAIVSLNCMGSIEEKDGTLLLLRIGQCRLRHFGFIKMRLLYARYYKKSWPFDRFSEFVSAYSYPRRVRLVSFREGDYYNLFPMDLLGGTSGDHRYVFGLRHTNVTLKRIVETGRLAVVEIPATQKDTVYGLARHHGSSPPALNDLPFGVAESRHFGFYIPEWSLSYKEINILKTMNLGSHMLLWGVPVGETLLREPAPPLCLVHFLEYFHQKQRGLAYPLV